MVEDRIGQASNYARVLLQGWSVACVAMFSYFTASRFTFLHETYWAPIAAVVVLFPEIQATRKASVERFLGTVIGSLVGWGTAEWWRGSLVFYGAGVLVAVGCCYLLRFENASRLSAVAVTVITLVPRNEPAGVVAFHRFIEVSYGLVCAVAYMELLSFARAHSRWLSRSTRAHMRRKATSRGG